MKKNEVETPRYNSQSDNSSVSHDNKEKFMDRGFSRREFLGVLGVGIGSACVLSLKPHEVSAGSSTRTRSILYDSSKCINCHSCEAACKTTNNLTGDYNTDTELTSNTWLKIKVTNTKLEEGTETPIIKRLSCTHCGSCAKVCPSKALSQRADGIVEVDSSKCIGCHYCHQACPFDIPRYASDGTIRKCSMCSSQVDEGKVPACVEACPVNALNFGYRDEIIAEAKERVAVLNSEGFKDAYLYGEKELGGIPLMSILKYSPEKYRYPEVPMGVDSSINSWKLMGSVLGVGLVAAGGLKYFSDKKGNDK